MSDNARTIDADLGRVEKALREYADATNLEVISAEILENCFAEKRLHITLSFDPDPQYELCVDFWVTRQSASQSICSIDISENNFGNDLIWGCEIKSRELPSSNGIVYPGKWPKSFIQAQLDISAWFNKINLSSLSGDNVEFLLRIIKESTKAANKRRLKKKNLSYCVDRIAALEAETAKLRNLIENMTYTYGTSNGQLIDDEVIERMSVEAETGYDIASLCQKCKEKEQGNDN